MKKRVLSFILVLSMILGSLGMATAAPTEAAQDSIDAMVEAGFVEGDEGGLRLDETIKRSEVAVIATRIAGLEDIALKSNYQGGFADVTPSLWDNPIMNGSINVAAGQGFVKGYPDGTFAPNADVTNAEIITLMVRLAVSAEEVAELDKGAWPAAYITKAAELGLFENTDIKNYQDAATRETVFVLGYNANAIRAEEGNYIVKVLVLENNRVETIGKDVVVEVIQEVQRADFAEASRKQKGDQLRLNLSELADAEDLLGKVVNLSFNKADNVVKVDVDNTYDYLTGKVTATREKLTVGRTAYTVLLDERYKEEDDRIFRTYLNDKAMNYQTFYAEEKGAEFARVTVKNGKVIFIDAYNFEDIAPVKDVTEVRGKDTIVAYDDVRDGNTIEIEVKNTTRVNLVSGKTFTVGNLEDVKVDNVLHTYKSGNTTKYLVLQDDAVEGKLEKVAEDKDGVHLVVDGDKYTLPEVSPKKAVYEFKSNDKFYTLDADNAYRELDTFRGEEVRVLLALDGKVQYVGSKIELNEYVGVATRVVGRDIRVLNPDNKLNDYSANLDTKVEVGTKTTGHSGLNEIDKNSLVYINSDDKTLVKVVDLDERAKVEALDKREVEVEGVTDSYRITDDTVIYVVNTKGDVEVRAIKDVAKAYEDLTLLAKDDVTISLIDELGYHKTSVRGYKFARATDIHTMVLYNLNIEPKGEDAIFAKLTNYDDRKVGRVDMTVELANGAKRTFVFQDEDAKLLDLERNAIYKIVESKETEGKALKVQKVVNYEYLQVQSIENGLYTFVGGATAYETRNTETFGKKPVKGDRISFVRDTNYNKDMTLIVNPGFGTTTGGDLKDAVSFDGYLGAGNVRLGGRNYIIKDADLRKFVEDNEPALAKAKLEVNIVNGELTRITGLVINANNVTVDASLLTNKINVEVNGNKVILENIANGSTIGKHAETLTLNGVIVDEVVVVVGGEATLNLKGKTKIGKITLNDTEKIDVGTAATDEVTVEKVVVAKASSLPIIVGTLEDSKGGATVIEFAKDIEPAITKTVADAVYNEESGKFTITFKVEASNAEKVIVTEDKEGAVAETPVAVVKGKAEIKVEVEEARKYTFNLQATYGDKKSKVVPHSVIVKK